MNNLIKIIVFGTCFISENLLRSELLVSSLIEPDSTVANPNYKWTNSSYVGYAWSLKAGITNPDLSKFSKVGPGDTDDTPLTNVSYAGISLGRHVCKWLTMSFSYEIFNSFNYQSYHTGGSLPGQTTLDSNFLRSFSVLHQSALLNFYLDLPKKCNINLGDLCVKPVIGSGLGVGVNQMSAFQTLTFTGTPAVASLSTQGFINLQNSLAWYVNIGVSFQPKGTAANFGVAYRYYDGGKFSSGNKYIVNDSNEEALIDLAAWTGKIKTNQLKLFLDFDF